MTYTKGPWYSDGGHVFVDTRHQVCCGRPGEECCGCPIVEGDYFEVAQTSEKDARLISAAPDMYEALEEAKLQIRYLHEKFSETGTGNAVLAKIEAALLKAKGDA